MAHQHSVVMTIDAGSGSCRALVFDAAGRLLGLAQQEWEYTPAAWTGGLDFNTQLGWRRVAECVRGALLDADVAGGQVAAVTATSMREGFVLYDRAGQEIYAVPNVDARASREAVDLIEGGMAEPFYRRGGDWTSIAAPARLRWVKEHLPEVWECAHRMTMLGDWVLQRLSGEFVTDPSLGSSSGLFDLRTRAWSAETAAELEIRHLLPPVNEAGQVIGAVSARAAEETGLAAGTPVVAGGADTQLALLGAGTLGPNRFGVVGGTYWLAAAVVDRPLVDPQVRLRTLCHVVPDQWMIEGVGFIHGLSTRWARDGLFRAANPLASPGASYEALGQLAAQCPPGANGVSFFCSNVMNARCWKHAPPTLVGVNPLRIDETGLGAIFRAIMEEAAYVARGHLDILAEVCAWRADHVDFVGGPTRSKLWPQLLADVLGVPVRVPAVEEATCFGAALCALVGVGSFASLDEAARATAQTERTYEPAPAHVAAYAELYPRWRALNDHMLAAADLGLAPHLWKGAGA